MTQRTTQVTTDIKSGTALLEMLSFKRPAHSKSEKEFIKRFIKPLGAEADGYGNFSLRIGDAPVMWSSHTDTVHHTGGRQRLIYTAPGVLGIDPDCHSNCLGADDTAGVWLMREMALAKIPGLYVFHRSEEIGGKGSSWIAKKRPELLNGIKFAIALDRRGKKDIITHQGIRTCSDDFAKSLGEQLSMDYSPCKWGSFTDTKNYSKLVGECTNLSVGYENAHAPGEKLDEQFLFELKEKLMHVDVTKLVESRKTTDVDEPAYTYTYNRSSESDYYRNWDDYEWDPKQKCYVLKDQSTQPDYHSHCGSNNGAVSVWQGSTPTIYHLVRDYPHTVASLLEDLGYDAKTLKADIQKMMNIKY